MGSAEKFPDGWIRKESRSRPNQFYYFNTKTGKSQWTPPIAAENITNETQTQDNSAKSTKSETISQGFSKSSGGQSRLKISDKSKDVLYKKGKPKTPAQDRLNNIVKKNKSALAKSLKELIPSKSTTDSINCDKSKTKFKNVNAKRQHSVLKYAGNVADTAKSTESVNKALIESFRSKNVNHVDKSLQDEIPELFPPKNLAQERLRSLQLNLSLNKNNGRNENDATRVFSESFGLDNVQTNSVSITTDDEQMDWEPMNDTDYSFQELESMAVDILTESAYIIPDTNVFLDSLPSIKSVIEKDLRYSILIPFVVLQELDQLKRRNVDELLNSKASRAIKYIYEELKAKNPRMQGQKATEDNAHIIDITSPDDKILNCLLQLKSQSKEIILVTNDINLSNKALMNGIEAITAKQCLERF